MTKRILSVALATTLMLPVEALGISYTSPAPERPQVDANSVDVQSLAIQYTQKFLSIGPQGIGGLDYTLYPGGRDSFTSGYHYVYPNIQPSFIEVGIGNYGNSFLASRPQNPDGSFTQGPPLFTFKDGTDVDFSYMTASTTDEAWYIAKEILYPNGVRVNFHYGTAHVGLLYRNRIQSVTTNTGYQMKFNYAINTPTTPAELNIWSVPTSIVAVNNAIQYCDPDADTCSLSGWPTLQMSTASVSGDTITTYTDPLGHQTVMKGTVSGAWGSQTGTGQIQTADSSSYNIVYAWAQAWDPCAKGIPPNCTGEYVNRTTSATINGRTTSYVFSSVPNTSTTVDAYAPLSQHYSYKADMGRYGIRSVTDPLNRVTVFDYASDYDRRIVQTTAPESNSWVNTISDADPPLGAISRNNITQVTANAKPGSGQPAIAEHWSFPSCVSFSIKVCNQPESHTDARGNTTYYTYSSDHGGVLTETSPPVGGISPVKRYAYEQRYAYIKDSGGGYVAAPTPIWVRTEERTCISTATVGNACAGGSSDEVVTSYDYGPNSGPNNLSLRGKVVTANGVPLRTCYAYDRYGNKMSETTPRAGLTSCP